MTHNEQYQITQLIADLGSLNEAEVEIANVYQISGYDVLTILKRLVERRKYFNDTTLDQLNKEFNEGVASWI